MTGDDKQCWLVLDHPFGISSLSARLVVCLAGALSLSVRLFQSVVFDSVVCRPTWVKEYFSDKKYLSDLRDKLLLSLMMKMTY